MSVSSVGSSSVAAANGGDQATILVAAKGLAQMKQDGADAVAMIASAAPAPSAGRGQLVNVMA